MKSKYKLMAGLAVSVVAFILVYMFSCPAQVPTYARTVGSFCVGVLFMACIDNILLKGDKNAD